jgi:Icc-related predicted phosphoesterase
MKNHRKTLVLLVLFFAAPQLFAQSQPVDLLSKVSVPFRFVAYGDTRFTDPSETEVSNPAVRRALVEAIDAAHPAFVSIGGDIAYNGHDLNDWKTWDSETSAWRQHNITVYPALGNHDLHGDQKIALSNYFQRFPDLHQSRYYSVRAANSLMLVLDSSLDELSGPQGNWLASKLDRLPADVDFVFLVMHHPPYTSSSDWKKYGGGHSARPTEQALAKMLEARQQHTTARFVVIAGHVHNYERHEHGGVTYFVTGGGGAHAYPIERAPGDLYPDNRINYHYLLAEVDRGKLKITMNRLELTDGKAAWTQPDSVTITVPALARAKAGVAGHP